MSPNDDRAAPQNVEHLIHLSKSKPPRYNHLHKGGWLTSCVDRATNVNDARYLANDGLDLVESNVCRESAYTDRPCAPEGSPHEAAAKYIDEQRLSAYDS